MMHAQPQEPGHVPDHITLSAGRLWATAAAVAALGAWVMFDARPGLILLLLASAVHRVLLYEAAFGFTTARLYAQAYMMVVAAALVLLAVEVAHTLDTGRLFRRTAAVGAVLFVALLYWNHEAWIARRKIDRFSSTGKLDIAYLTRELSPDALPTIVDQLACAAATLNKQP